jgi:hypothetical protein
MNKGLSYTNGALSTIFSEISRRFGVNIQTIPQSLQGQTLSIHLSNVKNAKHAIANICRKMGWQFSKMGKTFIISKSR